MILVEVAVVATDRATQDSRIALIVCAGIKAGQTKMAKNAMPLAERDVRSLKVQIVRDIKMEATFKMSGIPTTFQLQLETIQHRQTYKRNQYNQRIRDSS
jgi:hypothetical protein